MKKIRVGEGWDVHALVEGRPLIMGGIEVPYHLGLLGHSDADVLAHAIIDCLLGAAALGDIGRHYSDTDPQFKGANSMVLLADTVKKITDLGWQIGNIDCTIVCQNILGGIQHIDLILDFPDIVLHVVDRILEQVNVFADF